MVVTKQIAQAAVIEHAQGDAVRVTFDPLAYFLTPEHPWPCTGGSARVHLDGAGYLVSVEVQPYAASVDRMGLGMCSWLTRSGRFAHTLGIPETQLQKLVVGDAGQRLAIELWQDRGLVICHDQRTFPLRPGQVSAVATGAALPYVRETHVPALLAAFGEKWGSTDLRAALAGVDWAKAPHSRRKLLAISDAFGRDRWEQPEDSLGFDALTEASWVLELAALDL